MAAHDDIYIFHHLDIPRTSRISIFPPHPRRTCKSVKTKRLVCMQFFGWPCYEIRTYDISGWHSFFQTVFFVDDFAQFAIVPVVHRIIFVVITHIHIQRPFLHLPLHAHIVGKFTSITFATLSGLEECADHRLWIGAFFHFLRLNRSGMRWEPGINCVNS